MAIDYSLASLIIASSIAVIALIGIIWSNKNTAKSNKLLEKDLQGRLRPWIQICDVMPSQMFTTDGRKISWDKYNEMVKKKEIEDSEKETVSFKVKVTNIGTQPTKNFFGKSLSKWEKFSKDELLKNGKSLGEQPLMPQEGVNFYFPIPFTEFLKLSNV